MPKKSKDLQNAELPQSKGKHLTLSDRTLIESRLNEGHSVRSIAAELMKQPSTILREIRNHTISYKHQKNNCLNFGCSKRYVCGNSSCRMACKNCVKCTYICSEYKAKLCTYRQKRTLKLCNGCKSFRKCSFDRERYEALSAHTKYTNDLKNIRSGFDLTAEEFKTINDLVTPLVKKGLSPYAIKEALGDQLSISEATLRRMIDSCELDARRIDLRDAVKRKPRKRTYKKMKDEQISAAKRGRLYEDYKAFIQEHDVNIVQMDCVEGLKEDDKTLLTLHIPSAHFQLAFIMDYHTASCVVDTLDLLEYSLGKELYQLIFGVILTDNGHEFTDIKGMEQSVYGGQRTKIFFCEPNRSDEKAQCETNHKLIRYVIPKGTSFENLTQPDICLMMSHINSYPRKSLYGSTPYQIASLFLPKEFFDIVGINFVPAKEINLTPSLLKNRM